MIDNAVVALYELYASDVPLTTTELAKRVFGPEDDGETRNADRKVRHYLLETYPHLIESDDEADPTVFDVRDDLVWFGHGAVSVATTDGEEFILALGRTLLYITEDDVPEVVSVEDVVDEEFDNTISLGEVSDADPLDL